MTEGTGRPGADPATLHALTRARSVARSLSDDLLTHLPDVGDIATQRLLDTWVEQAADTLRALSEALEERLLDLGRLPADADARDADPWVASPGRGVDRTGGPGHDRRGWIS